MSKIKLLVVEHYKIIILAIFLGILSSVPYYVSMHSTSGFQGIYNQLGDDVNYYRTRAKDVIDGHTFVSNPFIAEHKSDLSIQPWLPDLILGKSIQWLGFSVPAGFILWNSLLAPILLLLAYSILVSLTKSKSWSLLGTVLFYLYIFPTNFLRLPSPGFNFVFFLATLLFLLSYIKTEKVKYGALTSLFFGSLFYIYPWYWTFYVIFISIFIFLGFVVKLQDFPYKKYISVLLGGMCIGIPYFVTVWKSSSLFGYAETLSRQGVIHTHFPSGFLSVSILGFIILLFLFLYRKNILRKDIITVFIFSGLSSGIVAVNQHVITGINLEFSSHYLIGNIFFSLAAGVYLVVEYMQRQSVKAHRTVLVLVSVVILLAGISGVHTLIKAQTSHGEGEAYMQNYAPVFSWFNQHAHADEVVFSNDEIETLVPVYTSQNVFFSSNAFLFLAENHEIEERFIINHYFDTFTPEYVKTYSRSIFGLIYIDEYGHNLSKNLVRKLFGATPVSYTLIPGEKIDKILGEAREIQAKSFGTAIKSYQIDYIVWDTNKNPDWKIDRFRFLTQVFSNAGIIIYKVN